MKKNNKDFLVELGAWALTFCVFYLMMRTFQRLC
jgi:hypothetical protein